MNTREDIERFIKNAAFYLFFFAMVLMIAAFGLIAEA